MPLRSSNTRFQGVDPSDIIDAHDLDEAKRSKARTIGTGARWMGASQLAMQVVRIVSAIVLARMLTETDFGLVSLVTIVVAFYDRVLGDTGTTAALVQLDRITQGLASSVLWLNVAVGTLGTTVMVVFAEPLAAFLGERDAADLLRVVACIAVVSSFGYVPRALLRRRGEFRKLALANMTNAGVTACGSIALAQAGWGEWSLAVGNLAGSAAFMLAAWLQIEWRPSLVFRRSEVRRISRFSVNLSASNLFGYISYAGDRFIVGRFIGVAELGYYGLANRLMRYPVQTASQTYRDVIFPSLARLQGDPKEVGKVFGRSVAGIAFLLFPLCAGVAALAAPLVDVMLTERWAPTADILSIIAVTAGLQAVASTTGSLYNSRGRSDLALRWQIGSSIVLLAAYAIGAQWGLIGLALGYLIGTALLTPIAFTIGLRLIGAKVWTTLRPTVATGLAATGCGVAAFATAEAIDRSGGTSLVQLVAGTAAGLMVYLTWALLLRPAAFLDLIQLIRRRENTHE